MAVAEYVVVCTSRTPTLPDHCSPDRLPSRKAEVVFSTTSYELVGSREGSVSAKLKVAPVGCPSCITGWPSSVFNAAR